MVSNYSSFPLALLLGLLHTGITQVIVLPSIMLLSNHIQLYKHNNSYAQFIGYQDLALAVGKANDVISSLQLHAPKLQTASTDYFK